ncbi:MAG: hypothetical protein ACI9H8_002237 [Lysobacterales bacterium]|jgi:hypothetical protein
MLDCLSLIKRERTLYLEQLLWSIYSAKKTQLNGTRYRKFPRTHRYNGTMEYRRTIEFIIKKFRQEHK